jgi:hypothetical protein
MHCPGRNVAAFSRAIRRASTVHRQRHLSFENDVRGFDAVGVVGIAAIRPVLPNTGVTKALAMQLLFEFGDVHPSKCLPLKFLSHYP